MEERRKYAKKKRKKSKQYKTRTIVMPTDNVTMQMRA